MEIEQAAKRFYEQRAARHKRTKELSNTLARQELTHYFVVASLCEYFDWSSGRNSNCPENL